MKRVGTGGKDISRVTVFCLSRKNRKREKEIEKRETERRKGLPKCTNIVPGGWYREGYSEINIEGRVARRSSCLARVFAAFRGVHGTKS